jgi:type IV pilus assembly protein PilN
VIKIGINLATQPFRRDRPVLVAAGVLGTALIVLLAVLIYLGVNERGELADARRSVDQLQRKLKTVSTEQQKLDAVLRRPENAEVLERSQFLNALLYRKGISWTRIFADLEKVVPHNVRIMQIRPTLNSKNEVVLDMQVGTDNPAPLIKFLNALEASPLFGPAYVPTSAPPSQSEPLWKYRVRVNYAQKL